MSSHLHAPLKGMSKGRLNRCSVFHCCTYKLTLPDVACSEMKDIAKHVADRLCSGDTSMQDPCACHIRGPSCDKSKNGQVGPVLLPVNNRDLSYGASS